MLYGSPGTYQVIKKPDESLLAFLLGIAFGVMMMLSLVELFWDTATRQGFPVVFIAAVIGSSFYSIMRRCLPESDLAQIQEVIAQ